MSKKYILWFKEIDKNDIAMVGGKGANLGEMVKAGFPVPNGFCVTSEAYSSFLQKGKLSAKIKKLLADLDINDSSLLQKTAKQIQTLIINASIPKEIEKEITSAYKKISGNKDKFMAIRSSATAEDLPDASFAGQQETYLNIKGAKNVLDAVEKCWASLFTARAIFYREQKGFDHFQVKIAVPVQEMIQSQCSGVLFTIDPMTNDTNKIAIEAAYGLGSVVVSGEITPDQYLVDKESLEILDKKIVKQTEMFAQNPKTGITAQIKVSRAHQSKQKTSKQIHCSTCRIG